MLKTPGRLLPGIISDNMVEIKMIRTWYADGSYRSCYTSIMVADIEAYRAEIKQSDKDIVTVRFIYEQKK